MKNTFVVLAALLVSSNLFAQTKPKTSSPSKTVTKQSTSTTKQVSNPITMKSQLDSFSYAIGTSIGSFYKQQGLTTIKTNLMLKGIGDAMSAGGKQLIDEKACNEIITNYINEIKSQKAGVAKIAGRKFLEENAKKAGVVTLASGLQYKVIKAGTDTTHAKESDQVKCHYHGTLIDGTVFDSSIERGEPVTFEVTRVITGWTEALKLMTPGSTWMLYIPSELAYGDNAAGPAIPPGSTLIFQLELLEIIKQ